MQKELSFGEWQLVVNLQGGRIEELSYKEMIILGTFQRIDGKKGNTHVSVPNFDLEGTKEYGLPPHGAARNMTWQIKVEDKTYLSIYCAVPATDLYKANLYVEQIFELTKDSYKQTVIVENTKGETVPINIGIHNYWATPKDWLGTKINGIDVAQKIKNEGQSKVRKSNTIVFSDGRRFRLKLNDFGDIRLWTAFNEKKEFDHKFVCIEPIKSLGIHYFGSKQSMLKEGKAIGASQEISLI